MNTAPPATPSTVARGRWLMDFRLSDGALEALKWLALMAMTVDHINTYVFARQYAPMFWVGRIAMPLFAAVLAWNLARPDTLTRGVYRRTLVRLLLFGALAAPAFIAGGGAVDGGWPLNILFLFATAVLCLWCVEVGGAARWTLAVLAFLIGGVLCEFFWPGLALTLALWAWFRYRARLALAAALLAWLALYTVNGNWLALLAIPILLLAQRWQRPLPRLRWAFYAYYPLHITALWAIGRIVG
jgi:TraX protein